MDVTLPDPSVVIDNPCSTGCGHGCGCPNDRWQQYRLITAPVPTGWLCPRCAAVNAPHITQCPCSASWGYGYQIICGPGYQPDCPTTLGHVWVGETHYTG